MSPESERVFSGTIRQITPNRARLTGAAIAKAECLRSWIKNGIEPIEGHTKARMPIRDDESENTDVKSVPEDSFSL
jgi:hypothetical protein